MAEKIRILLADDHQVLRSGLKALLNMEPDLDVVADVGDGREAVEAAMKEVEEAMKGDDKDAITTKTDSMMAASHKLSEKMYADVQKSAAAQGEHDAARPQAQPESAKASTADDNVVDADFKEVKK